MKKTRFIGLFLAIILMFTSLVPATAFAAQDDETADGEVIDDNSTAAVPYMLKTECINEDTNEVKVWLELNPANAESITAFSIALRVVNKNGEIVAGRSADFTFADSLMGAEIKKSNFDSQTQVMNLYIASTKNLVQTSSEESIVNGKKVLTLSNILELGTIKVGDVEDKENNPFKVVLNGRLGGLMIVGLDAEVKDVQDTVEPDFVIPVDGVVYNAPEEYIVTTDVSENGQVNLVAIADGVETAVIGNTVEGKVTVRIDATPDEGYELKSIRIIDKDGVIEDITESKQFVVDGDKTVVVVFDKINAVEKEYTVKTDVIGKGDVQLVALTDGKEVAITDEKVAADTIVLVKATPANGSRLVSVKVDGEDITSGKEFIVNGDKTVTVEFTEIKNYTVRTDIAGNGDVVLVAVVDGKEVAIKNGVVTENTVVRVKVNADKGYKVESIKCGAKGGRAEDITVIREFVANADEMSVRVVFVKVDNGEPDDNCSCMCHKTGFMGFIYKIARAFWKLFRIKQNCECGEVHY